MKIIQQVFWIFLMALLGQITATLIAPIIAVPGSVLGMLYLFIALQMGWLRLDQVKQVGDFLTGNMSILFVPAGVGLMTVFDVLGAVWWQLALILLITIVSLMVFAGKFIQWLILREEEQE